MTEVSADTVRQIWIVTLALYVVVLLVVAALLTLILRTARRVRAGVSSIWTVGQQVANNTGPSLIALRRGWTTRVR